MHSLWKYSFDIWEHRNQVVHGRTFQDKIDRDYHLQAVETAEQYRKYVADPGIPSHSKYLFESRILKEKFSSNWEKPMVLAALSFISGKEPGSFYCNISGGGLVLLCP